MSNRRPLIDEDGEVREVTAEEVSRFKPFSALPKDEQKVLLSLRRRGPQKAPKKIPVSIRLSPEVVEGLRATGNGWQGRADDALKSWLARAGKAHAARGRSNGPLLLLAFLGGLLVFRLLLRALLMHDRNRRKIGPHAHHARVDHLVVDGAGMCRARDAGGRIDG